MTLHYLLDTDVISEMMRPRPDGFVIDRIHRNVGRLATASVVWHEILYGAMRLSDSQRRGRIMCCLWDVVAPMVTVLSYDTRAAGWHAEERARLSVVRRTPPLLDGQIAAIAYANGLTLVTNNVHDYEGFRDLRVERWHR
jgi:tRNA(fMet)-specific endonuclease VapC